MEIEWKAKDYLLFFIAIPIFIILLYILPTSVKNFLILDMKNITPLNIFFSNYIHTAFEHISSNLIAYFIVMFFLFYLETDKKMFYYMMFLMFIALPILLSLISIHFIPNLPPELGFSGIASGLLGYFIYVVYGYMKKLYDNTLTSNFPLLVLMINLSIITLNYINIFILSSLLSVFLAYTLRTKIKNILKKFLLQYKYLAKLSFKNRLAKLLVFIFSFLLSFYLPILIPTNIIIGGSIINIASHYFGYIFGIFVPIIINGLTLPTKKFRKFIISHSYRIYSYIHKTYTSNSYPSPA